jgi:hypothetical protein
MLFAILTVLALGGTLFARTRLRYKAQSQAGSYPAWLLARLRRLFSPGGGRRLWAWFLDWTARFYPGWMRWVFLAIAAGFLYLAASGFLYGIVSPRRGMFGYPLVAHVAMGAVYAFGLAFVLLWRARDYAFDKAEADALGSFSCPIFKTLRASLVAKILFWFDATAGLVIILTALFSMLPILPASAQKPLAEIHRYAALLATAALIVLADIKLVPAAAE